MKTNKIKEVTMMKFSAHYYFLGRFLILVMVTSVCQAAPTGLVGYWRFDQVGNAALDSSGNRNNGNIVGSNNRNGGVEGQALIFDNKKKTKVEIPVTKTLDLVEAITMEAWIQPKSLYIGNDWKQRPSILAKRQAYYLDINEKGNLSSYLYGVQPQEWLSGKTDMRKFIGQWVHVATVYNGNKHLLYINGQEEANVSKKGKITSKNNILSIGWVDNERYFDGMMDEVKLWNRGLTAKEIKEEATLAVEVSRKLSTIWTSIKTTKP